MAVYTAYVPYVIFFSNVAEYNAAVALCGGNGYGHCPYSASQQFGLPWPPASGPLEGQGKGMYGLAPYGIPVGSPGVEINHPNPSGRYLQGEVDSVVVPGQYGGPDMILEWMGCITLLSSQALNPPPSGTYAPIPRRRFIGGFEISGASSEGGTGFTGAEGGRIASRVLDGRGISIRGNNFGVTKLRQQNEFIPGLTEYQTWERFYIRINALGTNELGVWKSSGTGTPSNGAAVRISAAGKVLAYNVSLNPDVLLGTSTTTLDLNKWYLIDIIVKYSVGSAGNGRIRVWINHTKEIDADVTVNYGLGAVGYHTATYFGQHTAAENQWSVDLDDWIAADVPQLGGAESLTSIDWRLGSHVRVVNVVSGTITNYTGTIELCNQHHNAGVSIGNSYFVSTTSGATIVGLTDRDENVQDALGYNLGPAALLVGAFTYAAGSVTGQLGYGIAGSAVVYADITESAANQWRHSLYTPSGQDLPTPFGPLTVAKKKSTDAISNNVHAVTALIEDIGAWGPEDDSNCEDFSNSMRNYHNARYANTMYSFLTTLPTAPCCSYAGTYVGNGTSQYFTLPNLPHFIFIRALSGASYPVIWFAAGFGGHRGAAVSYYSNEIIRVWIDSLTGEVKFSVAGNDAAVNATGITYQYVMFCDPGSRFNHCGSFHNIGGATSVNNALWVDDFLAEGGFIQRDLPGSTLTSTDLSWKGPGCGANDGYKMDGTQVANWGSFSSGVLTTRADVHVSGARAQSNYSLWRSTNPNTSFTLVQIFSYTGNGAVDRTLVMPNVSGLYPVFALVIPHNGVNAYFRDPSHTGANSCTITTLGNVTTAIKGASAPDTLDIGSTINSNGVVYDVFVIMGSSTGWNNGTFWLPNYLAEGPYEPPTYNPTSDPVVYGEGGLDLDGDPSLLVVQDLSGIYTLVPGKTDDTFYDRLPGVDTIDQKIPDPTFKTGFIGG